MKFFLLLWMSLARGRSGRKQHRLFVPRVNTDYETIIGTTIWLEQVTTSTL